MFTMDFNGWTKDDLKNYMIARYNFALSCDDFEVADEVAAVYTELFNEDIKGEI